MASSECPPRSKKLSVVPTWVDAEDLGPDPGEQFLGGGGRGDVAAGQLRAARVRGGQRGAVEFPVRGQRQRGQFGEHCRDHEPGQLLSQVGAQAGGGRDARGGSAGTSQATSRAAVPPPSAVTTAAVIAGWVVRAVSISPGSIR